MTKKIFRLMFLTGLLVLSSLSAGCGMFSGKEVTALKLENANLQGRLESTDRELERAEDDVQDLESELLQAKSENSELKQQLAGRPVSVASQGRNVIQELSGRLLFAAGSATLSSAGKGQLDGIASRIKGGGYGGRIISIEAQPDTAPLNVSKPKWKTNMWLAANRARAVARYLMDKGVPENRLRIVGRGDGRPSGRRIEIVAVSR